MDLRALLEDLERLEGGAFSDRLLQARRLEGAERARHTALLRACLENWRRHDWVLAARLARPPRPRLRAALRLGLELLEEGRPPHAVLSGLLAALPELSAAERGLVNAVLRGLLRDNQALAPLPPPHPPIGEEQRRDLAAALSLPPWFLDLVERLEGPELLSPLPLAKLRAELIHGRGLWLRVNPARWRADEALADLAERGLEPLAAPETPLFIRLGRPPREGLAALPPLADGRLRVQDLSAWGALALLDAQPGERVLDLCAAPGGKSLALLDMVPGLRLCAVEADAGRARALARRLEGRAELLVADGRALAGTWDRVLADIPCSGSGTVGHRPDVLLKTDPVQPALLALQAELLAHAATLVRPGGRLVLSTCSLDPRENGEQAAKLLECCPFLRPRPDLAPATCRDEAGGWRWLPWTRPAGRPGGRPGAGGAWALALDRVA